MGFCIFAVSLSTHSEIPGNEVVMPVAGGPFATSSEPTVAAPKPNQQDTSILQQSPGSRLSAWKSDDQAKQDELRYTLPGEMVPQSAAADRNTVPINAHNKGSWSLGNSVLSLTGLIEGLLCLIGFFTRNTRKHPNLLTWDFVQRFLVLIMAFVFLVVTSISSDFMGPVTLFDKMSFPIIAIFAFQQLILFKVLKQKAADSAERKTHNRFRAKQRYENRGKQKS
jgi:hypothetical protein